VVFSTRQKRRSQKMNPATQAMEGNAPAPVLYMALELSNRSWRLAFGDGAKHRQVSVAAADLAALAGAVTKAKERFKMPASVRVVSCYEAGRDGFWLHRHLVSIGIENQVVDAASIEVSRRLRHVKTDRLRWRAVAGKADPASRGRAWRLERGARTEHRRGRRQAPAPGA
jgi:hypothetical protein